MAPYRTRSSRWSGHVVGVLAVVALLSIQALPATAQDGFDIQQFYPLPSQQVNHFSVASGRVLEHLRFEFGLVLNHANDPLVLFTEDDERFASVVSNQMVLDVLAAFGLFNFMELGVALPLVLFQEGDEMTAFMDAPDPGFGLGDVRIVPRFTLLSTESPDDPGGVSLGLMANIFLPVGEPESFRGEGFRIEPRLAFDLAFATAVRISANVGYMIRPETTYVGLEIDDTLTYGLALGIAMTNRLFLVPEVAGGASILADDLGLEELPLEARLGLKAFPVSGLLVELGGGMGIGGGFGTPDWRIFMGLSYSPQKDRDSDGDGYFDDDDACPEEPEDFDGFEDEDGCPEPDNDGDGILDGDDACPNDPEDRDGFQDVDGCPDRDNDADGILDANDACPLDPEDIDTFEDEDGCPDPDNDADGILDANDACPNDPETFNGVDDEDGCPDSVLVQEITCHEIQLMERVLFDTDSDMIQPGSFGMLNDLATLINARPDIRRIRVEGHTDSRNTDTYNIDLSQRRAESVVRYLVDHQVDASRIRAQGYGESRPVADNRTEEGMAQNRRVQLQILEQEGCETIVPPYK